MIETNERRSDVVATERYASDGDLFNLRLPRRRRQSRQSRQRNEKEKRIVIHHERTDTDE